MIQLTSVKSNRINNLVSDRIKNLVSDRAIRFYLVIAKIWRSLISWSLKSKYQGKYQSELSTPSCKHNSRCNHNQSSMKVPSHLQQRQQKQGKRGDIWNSLMKNFTDWKGLLRKIDKKKPCFWECNLVWFLRRTMWRFLF